MYYVELIIPRPGADQISYSGGDSVTVVGFDEEWEESSSGGGDVEVDEVEVSFISIYFLLLFPLLFIPAPIRCFYS